MLHNRHGYEGAYSRRTVLGSAAISPVARLSFRAFVRGAYGQHVWPASTMGRHDPSHAQDYRDFVGMVEQETPLERLWVLARGLFVGLSERTLSEPVPVPASY